MKTLQQLIQGLNVTVTGPSDVPITDVVFDSRKVVPGSLFVALKGAKADGRAFMDAAVKAGAVAVISDEASSLPGATLVVAPDPLALLAPLSVRFWDDPSKKLLVIGITGTNGKTTISYLLESILKTAGWNPGVIGTISYRFGDHSEPAPNTTPFASEIQRFMASVRDGGGRAVVMEVSSHALALGRVAGVDFDVAVFTNLTQDHLDFHKNMDDYSRSKAILFQNLDPQSSKPYPRGAVLNLDDPSADRMRSMCRVPVLGYRLHGPADLLVKYLESDAGGSRFTLQGPKGVSFKVALPLIGDYNVMNALAAAGAALLLGIDAKAVQSGLESIPGVPGRMERVDAGQSFSVIVDYAHTEDALKNVLTALRHLKPERIITVFGCGGDRDRAKRPLMGEIAARMSEEVIVTSDNPRGEDPEKITLDIEVGIRRVRPDHYEIIVDREQAIAKALKMAQSGDIVLLAGKGHETYQILEDKTIHFDDRETARKLLS